MSDFAAHNIRFFYWENSPGVLPVHHNLVSALGEPVQWNAGFKFLQYLDVNFIWIHNGVGFNADSMVGIWPGDFGAEVVAGGGWSQAAVLFTAGAFRWLHASGYGL